MFWTFSIILNYANWTSIQWVPLDSAKRTHPLENKLLLFSALMNELSIILHARFPDSSRLLFQNWNKQHSPDFYCQGRWSRKFCCNGSYSPLTQRGPVSVKRASVGVLTVFVLMIVSRFLRNCAAEFGIGALEIDENKVHVTQVHHKRTWVAQILFRSLILLTRCTFSPIPIIKIIDPWNAFGRQLTECDRGVGTYYQSIRNCQLPLWFEISEQKKIAQQINISSSEI